MKVLASLLFIWKKVIQYNSLKLLRHVGLAMIEAISNQKKLYNRSLKCYVFVYCGKKIRRYFWYFISRSVIKKLKLLFIYYLPIKCRNQIRNIFHSFFTYLTVHSQIRNRCACFYSFATWFSFKFIFMP